ncbi:pre-peptidase C-terminal domain-containing protein [Colwellia sp. RSH04]|uniref:pre-peptidase C-terminal domain-containing protein n=1 Tax=Colwellia sp. RSH04 TaxID=2305464 RepID=UPI000E58B432|nr:pre-peptidase C-terminal domain-containing protein [Colwellia sp. RSH04]RHW76123.1 cyanophycinase [Colwellia sp. RSH04]
MNINKTILSVSLTASLFISTNSHACLTSEIESNNSENSANSGICSNTTVEGNLSRNDIDWFEFQVSQAGSINISLDHHRRDDFDWHLYQESGSAVAQGDTNNRPETGSFQATSAGTYYVKLTRYKGSGWYDLNVTFPEGDITPPPTNDCSYGSRPSKPGTLKAYIVGNSNDNCSSLTQDNGAVLLMGGGSDVDSAFSNRVAPHIGTNSDIVVLRTSGTDAYNGYLQGLTSANSVETLIIDTRTKANDPYVDWAIRSAEFVWISGGDQSDYLNQWHGTSVQTAIQHVFDKGGVVGGTSAGMALMANSIYDPDGVQGAVSSEVVTNFCHNTLQFSNRFISIPMLNNSLTDTHFQERDRMGRATVSLGHHSSNFFSIAASEGTSMFLTSNGNGVVDGYGEVYVLRETTQTQRQTLSCNQAVSYLDVLRTKLVSGESYNVFTHSHNGDAMNISINGNNNNFYTPSNPY